MQLYCGCLNIPIDNKGRTIVEKCICFVWEKKWYEHTYEGRLIVETSTDILQGPKSNGCPLKTTSFPYKHEETQTAWKVFYLSQHLRTKEQIGNVASVQNGCARTTLSRHFIQNLTTIQTNFIHIFVLYYILLSTKIF